MSGERDIRRDLEADAPDEIVGLARRLEDRRPVPSAVFRGELRRHLLRLESSRARPARLRASIAGYAAAGAMLLLAGALSAAGLGPLGT
jgi:hypothetical protein